MFLFGLVAQQYYTYWTGGAFSLCFCMLAMLTTSLGFKDRIYLMYGTMPDRAALPLIFLIGSLLMCNLLSLQYIAYCMFTFLSKAEVLWLIDVLQDVASRVPSLVIYSSPIR
jgi:hypothetical protein